MSEEEVVFEKVDKDARLPERQHSQDAGYDLYSVEDVEIAVGEVKTIGTGLRMKLPDNMEAQVRPRSGLSISGLTVMNSPGTIDSGYRGEVRVIMGNLVGGDKKIEKGERIAQMVFSRTEHPKLSVGSLDNTERGEGGFGSTGV